MNLLDAPSAGPTPWATSISGFLSPILQGILILMLAWVGRSLMHLNQTVDRLKQAVFPDDQPSLPDKVAGISTDVAVIKDRGERKPHPTDGTDP